MKNSSRVISLAVALMMLINIPALAVGNQEVEQTTNYEEFMCYSDGEGRTLTNIDGEVFQVIDVNDADSVIVTDPELLEQLNGGNSRSTYSSSPAYDFDLTQGAYTASVNLANGTWQSPTFKRLGQNTGIYLPSGRYWINYFYYNNIDGRWKSIGFTDVKFSILVTNKAISHGSAGIGYIDRCFVQIINSSLSPQRFTVKIDVNGKYAGSLGGILT